MIKDAGVIVLMFLAMTTGSLFLSSCSSTGAVSHPSETAYVDMSYIFNYVLQTNVDYEIYRNSPGLQDFSNTRLSETEKEIKESILYEIDSAVRYVCNERDIDVVLNKSDELIYADDSLDITQPVINELKERYYRTSPVFQ